MCITSAFYPGLRVFTLFTNDEKEVASDSCFPTTNVVYEILCVTLPACMMDM